MNANLQGQVKLMFIRAGIGAKSGKPYLMVSNGRKEFFISIAKDSRVNVEVFENFSDGDDILLEIRVLAGSDNVELLEVINNE